MAENYSASDIAKYHAIGVAMVQQEIGEKDLTVADLYEYYEAALKDITLGESIDKSVIEFDKLMAKKQNP